MTPYTLHQGDCRDVMAGMEADSVDAIVHVDPPMVFTFSGRRQAWCQRCWRKRWMRNLLAQVYFDAIHMFCADRAECDAAMKPRKRKARKP